MPIRRIFLSAVMALALPALSGNTFAFDGKTNYKVGDRLAGHASGVKSAYKTVTWDDLMPKDWDPMSEFKKVDFSKMKDSDPRAMDALKKLRESWNNAPVEPSMNDARVRIPGFIVPLEVVHHQITEFLLVPYFGGCIHVPPPPANQIIHVFPAQPLKKGMQSMDAVWISGTMETSPSDTDMGSASYKMKAEAVEPYKE